MNMSYCRFQNTLADLSDCLWALEEADWDIEEFKQDMNEREARSVDGLIAMCIEIVDGCER